MYVVLMFMFAASMLVLFLCGYYAGIIKEKYGRSWLYAVPITIAILMVNIVWAIFELSKSARWQ